MKSMDSFSVQSLNCVRLFAIPWTEAHQASLSITNSQNLLNLISIELVMLSNNLIICHPLLLLPSIFLSIKVFSNESVLCMKWPKYWSFSPSVSPSNEYPGQISFRIVWFDLLALQGTLKNHSNKGGKVEAVTGFIFLGSKVIVDGDCSHEIKRRLLLGRKAMTNLDSVLKSRHILPTRVCISQSYSFSSSHVRVGP